MMNTLKRRLNDMHIFTKLFVDKYGYIRKHRYKKDKKQFLSKNYSKTQIIMVIQDI